MEMKGLMMPWALSVLEGPSLPASWPGPSYTRPLPLFSVRVFPTLTSERDIVCSGRALYNFLLGVLGNVCPTLPGLGYFLLAESSENAWSVSGRP